MNTAATIGAYLIGIGVLVSIINVILSQKRGAHAGENPWHAGTLEWAMSSPPPHYAFVHLPMVATREPLWDNFDEFHDPADERILDGEEHYAFSTTWLDAAPVAIAKFPEDTIMPLVVSLALFGLFTSLLLKEIGIACAVGVAIFLLGCLWLWPKEPKMEKEIVVG
jgi:hypothetical protein